MIMFCFQIRLRLKYNMPLHWFWYTVIATLRQAMIVSNECLFAVRTCPTSRNWLLHNKYKLFIAFFYQRAVTHDTYIAITLKLCPNRKCVKFAKLNLSCSKHFEQCDATILIVMHQIHDTWLSRIISREKNTYSNYLTIAFQCWFLITGQIALSTQMHICHSHLRLCWCEEFIQHLTFQPYVPWQTRKTYCHINPTKFFFIQRVC